MPLHLFVTPMSEGIGEQNDQDSPVPPACIVLTTLCSISVSEFASPRNLGFARSKCNSGKSVERREAIVTTECGEDELLR